MKLQPLSNVEHPNRFWFTYHTYRDEAGLCLKNITVDDVLERALIKAQSPHMPMFVVEFRQQFYMIDGVHAAIRPITYGAAKHCKEAWREYDLSVMDCVDRLANLVEKGESTIHV